MESVIAKFSTLNFPEFIKVLDKIISKKDEPIAIKDSKLIHTRDNRIFIIADLSKLVNTNNFSFYIIDGKSFINAMKSISPATDVYIIEKDDMYVIKTEQESMGKLNEIYYSVSKYDVEHEEIIPNLPKLSDYELVASIDINKDIIQNLVTFAKASDENVYEFKIVDGEVVEITSETERFGIKFNRKKEYTDEDVEIFTSDLFTTVKDIIADNVTIEFYKNNDDKLIKYRFKFINLNTEIEVIEKGETEEIVL